MSYGDSKRHPNKAEAQDEKRQGTEPSAPPKAGPSVPG